MSVIQHTKILQCDAEGCEATVELLPGYAAFDSGWVILRLPYPRHLCPEHNKDVPAALEVVKNAIDHLGRVLGVDCYYIHVKAGLLRDFGVIPNE